MRVAVVVMALAVVGCKAIPLADDPMMPSSQRARFESRLFEVDWWQPLVKPGLLEFQPHETARPAVDLETERVVVLTRDGMVRCLNPDDGSTVWVFATGSRFYAGATVVDGVVYVPGGDGQLYALRALTGEKLWAYQSNEELVTAPVVTEGRVLVASQSETLFAIDRATGQWQWQYRRDPPSGFSVRGASRPVVHEGLVIMGFADGAVAALGLDDGVARWDRRLTVSGGTQFLDVDTEPVVDEGGRLYLASYKDGVYAMTAASGDLLWSRPRAGITSLLRHGDTLFLTGDGSLTALETGQGRVLWSLDLSERTPKGRAGNAGQGAMLLRGSIVVPTAAALVFVDPRSGRVRSAWSPTPGRGVSAMPTLHQSVRHGARLYVVSNMGAAYALRLSGTGG